MRIWDTASGRLLNTLVGHSFYVNAVAFSPDDRRLASASSDGAIKLWPQKFAALLARFEAAPA